LKEGNIFYEPPEFRLPEPQVLSTEHIIEQATFHWERWGGQAKDFLEGAEFYRNKRNYRLTAFLLHQITESALNAIIQAILGYGYKCITFQN
jgi:hypothetical protein